MPAISSIKSFAARRPLVAAGLGLAAVVGVIGSNLGGSTLHRYVVTEMIDNQEGGVSYKRQVFIGTHSGAVEWSNKDVQGSAAMYKTDKASVRTRVIITEDDLAKEQVQ